MSERQTALHRAAMVGNSEAMAALIQAGCALDLRDRDGNTALHEVSWHGFSQCVKLLVKARAGVNIRNKMNWPCRCNTLGGAYTQKSIPLLYTMMAGNTALHLACQNAHAQTARLLLHGGATPDTKNNVGDTCLHMAARYNNLTLVKILLSSLCSVTVRNQGGDTALHVAAALNHKKTVQLLLETGSDGTVRNSAGKTALDKARDNNHKDVALLLARAPQVHRLMRGRTIKKRRERLTAEPRSQSVTREEIPPHKEESGSTVEETPSSDEMEKRTALKTGPRDQQQLQQQYQNPATKCIPHSHHRARDINQQALNEADVRKDKDVLCEDGEDGSTQKRKTYQLYTLYRDKEGNIKQVPATGCHCKPQLRKLEGKLKLLSSRLGKMEQGNRHQMTVLDVLNQERAAAERKNMIYRIEQQVAQSREEVLMIQEAESRELKRWFMSQLKDRDEAKYSRLLSSPSVADTDLETLPLLSVVSGDSSTSLTYTNILPSQPACSLGDLKQEQMGSKTYFEMKGDRSPDHYENAAQLSGPASSTSTLQVSPALHWPTLGVQHSPVADVVPLCGEGLSSGSSQYNICNQEPTLVPLQEHRCSVIYTDSTRALSFCTEHSTEPTFSQERNHQRAHEVTQRFFETVSTQLERWYERKVMEVEQQTELRAQQDRKELLQRISTLEEELQRLTANSLT